MNKPLKELNLSIDNRQYKIKCHPDKSKAIINSANELTHHIKTIQANKPNLNKEQVIMLAALQICSKQWTQPMPTDLKELEKINEKVLQLMLK